MNITVPKNDVLTLQYSGSRWYGMSFEGLQNRSDEEWVAVSLEVRCVIVAYHGRSKHSYLTIAFKYHAFWNQAYNDVTKFVSDSTRSSTPIGTDFYLIGERDERHGVSDPA